MKSEKETIYDYAAELKLLAFKEELECTLSLAAEENWNHLQFLTELLGKESARRRECRRRSRIRSAGFPQMKYLHELVMEDMPKEAQVILPELETLDFIRQGRNLVLYGNPGTGKTHIATALGIKACQQDFTVLFTSVPVLLTQIREAKSAKTLRTLQLRFEKYDLVICDEFGYVSCDKEGGELLFNHLSLRAGKKATIITTNLAFNRWIHLEVGHRDNPVLEVHGEVAVNERIRLGLIQELRLYARVMELVMHLAYLHEEVAPLLAVEREQAAFS